MDGAAARSTDRILQIRNDGIGGTYAIEEVAKQLHGLTRRARTRIGDDMTSSAKRQLE